MKKTVLLTFIIIIIVFGFYFTKFTFADKNLNKNQAGNTNGNLINNGFVCEQGDWIYYSGESDGFGALFMKLFKFDTVNKTRLKLNDDSATNINIVGNWLYYCNLSECKIGPGGYCNVYKIKLDGSMRTKLNDINSFFINVVGDWIYFNNKNAGEQLWKAKTDGTNLFKLSEEPSYNINIIGDWIYYCSGDKILKIKTDGSNRKILASEKVKKMVVDSDWIYFVNQGDGNKLYKIKTNGTNKSKVNNDNTVNINIKNGFIYYVADDRYMYKMKLDGTDRKDFPLFCSGINIIGNWIYYHKEFAESEPLYRIKSDGSEDMKFE